MCQQFCSILQNLTSNRMAMSTTRCRVAPCTSFTTVLAADEEATSTSTSMYLSVLQVASPMVRQTYMQAKLQHSLRELSSLVVPAAADRNGPACSIMDKQQCCWVF